MSNPAATSVVISGATGGLPTALIRRAVSTVLMGESREAFVAVTFLGLGRMREMNREFKHHDYPTDVISFTLPQPDGSLAGDLYLCRGVAVREARRRGLPAREELVRLIVHGTLHLLGGDHPEDASRETSPMWKRQEHYVRMLTA